MVMPFNSPMPQEIKDFQREQVHQTPRMYVSTAPSTVFLLQLHEMLFYAIYSFCIT